MSTVTTTKNTSMSSRTYRFKFDNNFLGQLKEFSRIHKFDEPSAFKDNWKVWCDENKEIIKRETDRLKTNGYEGDALVKMYKSARYYFKNKSNEKTKPKKRRQYVGLEPEFRDAIDEHINNVAMRREMKPADGYIDFMDDDKNSEIIKTETLRLQSYKFEKNEISAKFKKTYKNRYFTIQKTN